MLKPYLFLTESGTPLVFGPRAYLATIFSSATPERMEGSTIVTSTGLSYYSASGSYKTWMGFKAVGNLEAGSMSVGPSQRRVQKKGRLSEASIDKGPGCALILSMLYNQRIQHAKHSSRSFPEMLVLRHLISLSPLLLPVVARVHQPPPASSLSYVPGQTSRTSDSPSSRTKLPDPFTFNNGQKVLSRSDWARRREEISVDLQKYELGHLPSEPGTIFASLERQKLNVTVVKNGKKISFSSTIYLPDIGSGEGPFPAIIGLGQRPSFPIPPGVAVIVMQSDTIASQQALFSRGYGLFYDLHGANHTAGAMVAWAWGVGRLIDALEGLPASETKIDTKRLGISGCSYNGKGALVVGALEPRIKLTIPQEEGLGGSSCWRIAEDLEGRPGGGVVQTAREIVRENVWFSPVFDSHVNNIDSLPFDHHMLVALIAPRGLLLLGHSGIPALGPEAQWGCMVAARMVWKALGAQDGVGLIQVGGPQRRRCDFPVDKEGEIVKGYVGSFLTGDLETRPGRFETDVDYPEWSEEKWIEWEAPVLR